MKITQELTLLSREEVCGEKQLDVLKKYGTKSAITDLVILTGGYCEDSCTYMAVDDNSLKGRVGAYTLSSEAEGDVWGVHPDGELMPFYRSQRTDAIRPVLHSPIIFDAIYKKHTIGYNGVEEVAYGEYPQYAPNSDIQELLEQEFERGNLSKTGKNYTFDSTEYDKFSQDFQPISYDEYEYKGKKYIRIKALSSFSNYFKLSNGLEYKNGDNVWIEVSKVIWIIDNKTKTLVSKRGILSGIRFHTNARKYNGDFSTTDMKKYLDKYMLKDLI